MSTAAEFLNVPPGPFNRTPPGPPDRVPPGPRPIDPGPPHMQPSGNPGGYKQYLAPKPDQGPHQIPPGTEDRHVPPGPNDYNQLAQPQSWQQYGGNDVWGAYSMMLSQQANPQFADLIGQRAAAYGNALRMSGVQMLPFDQFQADVLHSLHLDELQQRYLQPRAGLGPGGVIG